tara:strand:- start:722 stop:1219 length:498 start_codon:yes stop_codon:yes gene_type:complete
MFDGLPVDRTEDTSTNNLQRKQDKLKRKQTQNYSEEREKEIKRLEEILNPPKTTYRKKKKYKMDMDEDEFLEQAFRENKDYWSNINSNKSSESKSFKENKKISPEKIKYRNEIKFSDIYNSLPEDIKSFINKFPDKDIYKKLSLKYHPDKGGNADYFKIINNYMN